MVDGDALSGSAPGMSKVIAGTSGARRFARYLAAPVSALLEHGNLTRELAQRDILGRYRGASFGLMWSLLGPLLMLVIYTIAFGKILGARWNQVSGDTAAFGMVLFLGILTHGFFAECLTRAPRLMVENANYVKRVVFPLHVLPWSVMLAALFHMLMNIVVFVVLNLVLFGKFSAHIVFAPLVILPLVLVTISVTLVFASLGVFIRDINQATPVIATAMLFLSSAIVPVDTLPPHYQRIFHLNPLTFFIDQMREVALWGRFPDWGGLAVATATGVLLLFLSHAWFQRTSKGFADVL